MALTSTISDCTRLALRVSQYTVIASFLSLSFSLLTFLSSFYFSFFLLQLAYSSLSLLCVSCLKFPPCFPLSTFSLMVSPLSHKVIIQFLPFSHSSSFSSHLFSFSSPILRALISGSCAAFLTMTPGSKVRKKKTQKKERTEKLFQLFL